MKGKRMNIQKIAASRLKPSKYNPRKDLKPSDPEYRKLKRSIEEFGYVEPIIWNERSGNIVGGHQRFKILLDLGETEIECVVVDLDAKRERALNVALNKITGEFDIPMLTDLLLDLGTDGFDLSITGFDVEELDELFGVKDKNVHDDDFDLSAALEKAAFVLPGDVWILGRHRLMCGDATKPEDVARLMDGKRANMCLTDAPYNVDIKGKAGKILNDNMPREQFYEFLLSAFKNIYEHLADGGAFYCFHSDSEKVNFFNATVDAGFHYSTTCIWVKDSLVLGRLDYQQRHEPCLYSWKKGAAHEWFSDRKQSSVWEFPRPKKSEYHSTQKPVPLMAYPIQNSSQTNAIVLDPFSGSFSTGIACEQTNRVCYAMELDPKYASASIRRFVSEYSADGVFVERSGVITEYTEMAREVERE